MSLNAVRWSLLSAVLALIVGCGGGGSTTGGTGGGGNGGSGGSGGDQSTTVTVQFTGGPTPTLAAVKVGSGNYTAQTISSNGTLTITLPAGTTTYSVAYLCPPDTQFSPPLTVESILSSSTQDSTLSYGNCPGVDSSTKFVGSMTGSVDASAFPDAEFVEFVTLAGQQQSAGWDTVADTFQVGALAQTNRVVIGLYDSTMTHLLAIKNLDNQTANAALNSRNPIVFSSSDAPTNQAAITVANLPDGYSTPWGQAFAIDNGFFLAQGELTQYPQLPNGILESGDFYSINLSSTVFAGEGQLGVGALAFPASGEPVTLTFPAPWSLSAMVTPAALPTLNFNYTGYAGKTGVIYEANIGWNPTSETENEILITANQNYLGSATTYPVPDLSSVSGFLTPPASGTNVYWFEYVYQVPTGSPAGSSGSYVDANSSYQVP
jgi:hypothetical protein